jgi:hypothetical protein
MTAYFYILYLGVSDATSGCTLMEVRIQYITVSHIYLMIEALQSMLHRFKTTTVPYYTIINDTINTLNANMSELEGNTAFCTMSANLQHQDAVAITDELIGAMDENTLDATIDSDVPTNALDSPSLVPFLYMANLRHIFSYGVQTAAAPDWTNVLRDLHILM